MTRKLKRPGFTGWRAAFRFRWHPRTPEQRLAGLWRLDRYFARLDAQRAADASDAMTRRIIESLRRSTVHPQTQTPHARRSTSARGRRKS